MCALARRNPGEVFLGLDNAYKPIMRAGLRALEGKFKNLRFLRADIRQALTRMPDETYHRVYLQFPVPGSAGKGRRPRFFNENFVEEIHRILELNGIMSVITDREGGFSEMLGLLEEAMGFRLLGDDEFHLDLDAELSSHNYQVWIGRGSTPHRFEVQKISAAESATTND